MRDLLRPVHKYLLNPATILATTALLLVAAAGVGLAIRGEAGEAENEAAEAAEHAEEEGEAEGPGALAEHLEALKEASPYTTPERGIGPAAADADQFYARAYPASDIPLSWLNGGQAAAQRMNKRKTSGPTWENLGPTKAVYQATDARDVNSYVPNEYIAGGRTVSSVISPKCRPSACRMWIAAAGGGIWRTDNALAGTPKWTHVSASFATSTSGMILLDPNDPTGNTLWVGTGEGNVCGSGCTAGVGLYKSTNGGDTWTGPLGGDVFRGRGVASIAVDPTDPNVVYAASTRALNGQSSVCCSGGTSVLVPGAAAWGLYKSTDGGATWTYLHNGATTTAGCDDPQAVANNKTPCSPRGVRVVKLDPQNPSIVYASSYARGIWRSSDGGATWEQIKPAFSTVNTATREWIDLTVADGKTRMYVSSGHTGAGGQYSRLYRSDDVSTGTPVFTDLTSADKGSPGYGSYNFCSGQCWYDNVVYTPAGHPDIVYLLGSYAYGETGRVSNGRAVLLSTDGGVSFTDMTMDATDPVHPNGIHPDEHSIVTIPGNPLQFIESGDGGLIRSSGEFADVSSWCGTRGLDTVSDARCRQLLSRVPSRLTSLNLGLQTLQFQSISVSPFDAKVLIGGTQDNGTFITDGSRREFLQSMWGDGGQSGFDAADPAFRFHTFYDASPDVNFNSGAIEDWIWIGDPIYGTGGLFYVPIISDPTVSKTMWVGTSTVMRTTTAGLGDMTLAEANQHCNEFTGDFQVQCGDWAQAGAQNLTGEFYGDRAGGAMAAVERSAGDNSTIWAATTTGRLFVSHNADAANPADVTWTRLDNLDAASPGRFISGVSPDPRDPNRAFVSYSGYSAATPGTPGHVFEVRYDPAGTATWTDRSGDIGDLPITDVVYDDATGALYASSDFGVYTLPKDATSWRPAAPGLPTVEVPGLTLDRRTHQLFAATHGLGIWKLKL